MALIAKHLPGIGNPLDMSLGEVEAWAERLAEIISRENGDANGMSEHRARVEADMSRFRK